MFWALFRAWSPRSWQSTLGIHRSDASPLVESSLLAVLALAFGATAFGLVFEQAGFEFSRDWQAFQLGSLLPLDLKRWLFSVAAVLTISSAVAYYLRPSFELAIGVIVLWFSASLTGSLYFVEN